jgi:hypothetical protein
MMRNALLASALGLLLVACAARPLPAPAVAASAALGPAATAPARGYLLVERGAMLLRGGALERREEFDVWRGPRGERWQRSRITAADGSYVVSGEWRSDAAGRMQAVRGRGAIGGEPLAVRIAARPGAARIEVRRGVRAPERLVANCAPRCFVDLAPSAIASFAMAREPQLRQGEVREFRWIGHALHADSVLLEGVARYVRLGEQLVTRPDGTRLLVRHDAFEETVTDARTGQTGRAFFNVWTDAEGRALKFGSSRTTGLREGYEDLAALSAASRDAVFPPAATR